jgi:phosphoglycolate phosphatase-like HAD superfamily hydrolase
LNPVRAVILDFDGVLAESNAEKDAAFEEFFALYPEYTAAMRIYHEKNYSTPRREKFVHYVEDLMQRPGDGELIDRMAKKFSELVVNRVIKCPEVPGTTDFLRAFSTRVPLYISSLTPHEELEQIVTARGIRSYMKDVYGNPPHAKSKVVRLVLQREGIAANEAVFVGDSRSDYDVASEAGMIFLGRDSGTPFPDINIDLSPDLYEIAKKLQRLMALLHE